MVLFHSFPAIVSGSFRRDPLLFPQWRGEKMNMHRSEKNENFEI